MRLLILLILIPATFSLFGQNGYIITAQKDTTIFGYIKRYTSISDGHRGLELWKDKRDKNPFRIPLNNIFEYAINKDTFRILHDNEAYENGDIYLELIDAKLLSRGKVNLFIIDDIKNQSRQSALRDDKNYPYSPLDGHTRVMRDQLQGHYTYIYILQDNETGYTKTLPSNKEKLNKVLHGFFSENYLKKYNEYKGEITYKSVQLLVTLYNSK